MSHLLVALTLQEKVLSLLVGTLCLAGCVRPWLLKSVQSNYIADISG